MSKKMKPLGVSNESKKFENSAATVLKKLSALTKYPQIFQGIYWDAKCDPKNAPTQIIQNRNLFAEDYELKKYESSDQTIYRIPIFDHCELYKCTKGYIFITSPYAQEKEEFDRLISYYGFKEYIPLYSDDCKTYIKKFENKGAFNSFFKQLQIDASRYEPPYHSEEEESESVQENRTSPSEEPTRTSNLNINLHPTLEEEEDGEKEYKEGTPFDVTLKKYERNKRAREQCIRYYGTDCYVCGFSFEKHFGEWGKGYIHVHHERPISSIGNEYSVDPKSDMKPVCPNCHAMLHHKNQLLSIDELRKKITKNFNDEKEKLSPPNE